MWTEKVAENKYTVCLIFDPTMNLILLQEKAKTVYKGLLNGVGGRIEDGEDPETGALREIKEETGLTDIKYLTWLGTLTLPYDCKEMADKTIELYFFSGISNSLINMEQPKDVEDLYVLDVDHALRKAPLAGNGDVNYFIKLAKARGYKNVLKEMYGNESESN